MWRGKKGRAAWPGLSTDRAQAASKTLTLMWVGFRAIVLDEAPSSRLYGQVGRFHRTCPQGGSQKDAMGIVLPDHWGICTGCHGKGVTRQDV